MKNRLLNNIKFNMAKRATALIAHRKSRHSPKTTKRLEIKRAMLTARKAKKISKKK